MEVRKWLEENEAPDHMPNVDVLFSSGAENIDIILDPVEEEEGVVCEVVLDITLPDDMERAIDVMVSIAYVVQDTSKVERRSARVIRLITYSPYNSYVFDYNKVWSKPDTEEEE